MPSYRDVVPELVLLIFHPFALLYSVLICLSCLVMMRRGFLIRPKPEGKSVVHAAEPQPPSPPTILTDPSLRIPHIPPELTDRIIDHLHNDKRTLRACSRVSTSWVTRSRYYLWQFVELDLKNYMKFEDILRDNPEIGYFVKSLKTTVYFFEEKPNWLDESLPRIARRLHSVEQLTLAGNGTYRSAPFHAFPSVKKLRVLDCEFASVNEFISLLCLLPSLEDLFSNNVLVGASATLIKQPTSVQRPKLKKLEFLATRLDPHMFTDWMIREGIHEEIESIILRPLQKGALIPVGRFISAVGPRLKHFEIAIIALQLQGGFRDVIGPYFDLSPATGLRSIEFGSPAGYAARYGSDDISFSWLSMMLSQVSSPVLEEVTLWLSQGDLLGLGTVEWKHVVSTLLSEKFKSVKKVHMRVWGQEKVIADIRRILEIQLKELVEKKVIEFDMHVSERKAFATLGRV
ncbi:hypothetical protein BXZ70DRAFT_963349 [Cristinia sonorae]|uniref:F-box domain-containing protein n=1 Tax=Cristinia sonorae TaxID=1940300 RepID=A0A8K0XJR4_9AGAR|nr:hypothetical protein BXZ70DRAFT_963349 [Cristinia sonorae]